MNLGTLTLGFGGDFTCFVFFFLETAEALAVPDALAVAEAAVLALLEGLALYAVLDRLRPLVGVPFDPTSLRVSGV